MYTSNTSVHRLSISLQNCIECIEDEMTDCEKYFEVIQEKEEVKFKHLCRKLKALSNLTPLDLFDMNKGQLLSVFSTSLTYIVVLVQFKTSELPLKGGNF